MLKDEIKQQETVAHMSYSMSVAAAKRREELQAQIDEFLARGGQVECLDISQKQANITFNYSSDEQGEKARENNRKKSLKASMKSKFNPTEFECVYHSDANPKKFVFIVGKYISRQYDRCDQAVNGRDFYRKKLES